MTLQTDGRRVSQKPSVFFEKRGDKKFRRTMEKNSVVFVVRLFIVQFFL